MVKIQRCEQKKSTNVGRKARRESRERAQRERVSEREREKSIKAASSWSTSPTPKILDPPSRFRSSSPCAKKEKKRKTRSQLSLSKVSKKEKEPRTTSHSPDPPNPPIRLHQHPRIEIRHLPPFTTKEVLSRIQHPIKLPFHSFQPFQTLHIPLHIRRTEPRHKQRTFRLQHQRQRLPPLCIPLNLHRSRSHGRRESESR